MHYTAKLHLFENNMNYVIFDFTGCRSFGEFSRFSLDEHFLVPRKIPE